GNSGPLQQEVSQAVTEGDLVVSAVLSGNRNFEGRINQQVKANYLASPPLVVAYALAGTVNIDLVNDSLGTDQDGNPVYLRDLWPTREEILNAIAGSMSPEIFVEEYSKATDGPEQWQQISGAEGQIFDWDPKSTYVQEPPFFVNMPKDPKEIESIDGARCLVLLGDSVTTDHISPAGAIKATAPAGLYLQEQGVAIDDFNSYGSRRGN
ncbi:MAG TPA: aconitate hydratase, partial [Planctomycetaceae bacterium]|nr:aconitate hydratase [Planctomycetaceae bacterium]